MKLRPYQKDAIQGIKKEWQNGFNKQAIILATGLGKTIIFLHLIAGITKKTGKKALILAHREELLEQAKDKLTKMDNSILANIEKAEKVAGKNAQVIIASVPTIGRSGSDRIKKFNPNDFGVVVVDECHHASASTYQNVLEHFGLLKDQEEDGKTGNDWNKSTLLLGVTATPSRNDNKGIDRIFDTVAYEYGIIQAIKDGWLAPIRAWRVNTETDLDGIKTTAGDFNIGELGKTVNNDDRNGLIVSAYKKITPNKQALCFAVDVEHANTLAKRFTKEGIKSEVIVGSLDSGKRAKILKDFSEKKIQVVVNCMVLTEGFDEPSIEVILLARPTQSGILFQQMIGRGTRLNEGKEHLAVIDFVDNTYRQKLQTSSSLLGLGSDIDFQGNDIIEAKEKIDKLLDIAPSTDLSKIVINNINYSVEEIDMMSGLKVPDEISTFTKFDWHRYDKNTYKLGTGDGHTMFLTKNIVGQYVFRTIFYDKEKGEKQIQKLGQWKDLKQAIKEVDSYITRVHPKSIRLVKNNAPWRKHPPTLNQEQLLRKFRINEEVLKKLNKGDAARLITRLISNRKRWQTKKGVKK